MQLKSGSKRIHWFEPLGSLGEFLIGLRRAGFRRPSNAIRAWSPVFLDLVYLCVVFSSDSQDGLGTYPGPQAHCHRRRKTMALSSISILTPQWKAGQPCSGSWAHPLTSACEGEYSQSNHVDQDVHRKGRFTPK